MRNLGYNTARRWVKRNRMRQPEKRLLRMLTRARGLQQRTALFHLYTPRVFQDARALLSDEARTEVPERIIGGPVLGAANVRIN